MDGYWSYDGKTNGAMVLYSGVLNANAHGHPVLEFDVARLNAAGSQGKSYYVYCDDPNAIVIVRNATTLPRDLSIITPHQVWIDGGFNTPGDPTQIRQAAIVTSDKVIGVTSP